MLGDPSPSPANLVLALYTYNALSADELSFHKGSVITVLGKEGEWWKGEVNEKVGLFPSNYVQPLTEQQPATEITRCECGCGLWCDETLTTHQLFIEDTCTCVVA